MFALITHLGGFSGATLANNEDFRRLFALVWRWRCRDSDCFHAAGKVNTTRFESPVHLSQVEWWAEAVACLLLLSAHVVMIWNISLFPGLSSIVPASSSMKTSQQPASPASRRSVPAPRAQQFQFAADRCSRGVWQFVITRVPVQSSPAQPSTAAISSVSPHYALPRGCIAVPSLSHLPGGCRGG